MSGGYLVIEGAKQNNLKDISLRLPHNSVIAVTGVSGSGKSSLAFETIFAEGQWRFIESLSTYARLFLEKLDRPDVKAIRNIRPAIALEQKNPVRGSRSTVGSLTEIYDFLRLLYAKASTAYCPKCGQEVRKWDPSSVTEELIHSHAEARAVITFVSDLDREQLGRKGLIRVWHKGRVAELDDPEADQIPRPYRVVLDRLVVRDEPRLADSVETAFVEGHGHMGAAIMDGPDLGFSRYHRCDACGIELPEPSPLLFSFNHPLGACTECKGFGNVLNYAEQLIIPDPYLSLAEGAIEPWEKPAAKWWRKQLMEGLGKAGINPRTPFRDLPPEQREMIFKGAKEFYGINDFFEELEGKRYKLHVRVFLSRYRLGVTCPACGGKKLTPEALAYKISGLDIADLSEMPVSRLSGFFEHDMELSPMRRGMAAEILRQIHMKLDFMKRVGLEYLTLSREGKTLSGGEYQRVNLSNQLASRLTGTLYVLDEPTVGLHKRDTDRITGIMKELADAGNTIVVVEHDRSVIEKADYVVELGPGGGHLGGEVCFAGPMDEFVKSDTITAKYLGEHARLPSRHEAGQSPQSRKKSTLRLTGASGNNLRNVSMELPLYAMTVVSGVSGSGKSTLIVDTLYPALMQRMRLGSAAPLPFSSIEGHEVLSAVKLIDQNPIGKSPRSNPLTYLKIFDPIRKLLSDTVEARAKGFGPGFFSFNVPGGRCETCKGEGYQKLEMYFFEDLYVRCEDCGGSRYGSDALSIRYKGMNISAILALTVDEALPVLRDTPQVHSRLALMRDVGLGYLRLGQPATTLSGGEAQRLKLCAELGTARTRDALYILDEPTVGLHASDVDKLMNVLRMLIDAGNTVLIIEHNLDVIARADWVIDLGPEGGEGGGTIVATGPVDKIMRSRKSYTGGYLKSEFRKN